MPVPSDPGWTLATDDHGCKVWRNPNDQFRGGSNSETEYCGGRGGGEEAGAEQCPRSSPIEVTPPPYAAPLTSPGACTFDEVNALADYFSANGAGPTVSEWSKQVSAECSACVFSGDGDRWAPILVVNDQLLRLNYGGCIELQTGKALCGRAYQALGACRETACRECTDLSELQSCINGTTSFAGACKEAYDAVTSSCGDGLQVAEQACKGTTWPFEGPMRVQCVTGAGADAGGGG